MYPTMTLNSSSSCLHLPSGDISYLYCHAGFFFFLQCWELNPGLSCILDQQATNWSAFPASSFYPVQGNSDYWFPLTNAVFTNCIWVFISVEDTYLFCSYFNSDLVRMVHSQESSIITFVKVCVWGGRNWDRFSPSSPWWSGPLCLPPLPPKC